MTPAQLKARQRELEENSDMAAAADTFGFEVEEKKEVKKEVAKPDMFDSLDRKGGKVTRRVCPFLWLTLLIRRRTEVLRARCRQSCSSFRTMQTLCI